ncbi:MAG: hypothetical protein IJI59_07325 [Clostridia bacterium]|nr:hypothetical protein [Clostridia bacterium]
MKNNQQKNRNQQCNQCHQKQQPQRREIAAMLANIDITDNMVSIPRDEYDELLYCSALVDILRRLYQTSGKYAAGDLLQNIFKEDDKKEDE